MKRKSLFLVQRKKWFHLYEQVLRATRSLSIAMGFDNSRINNYSPHFDFCFAVLAISFLFLNVSTKCSFGRSLRFRPPSLRKCKHFYCLKYHPSFFNFVYFSFEISYFSFCFAGFCCYTCYGYTVSGTLALYTLYASLRHFLNPMALIGWKNRTIFFARPACLNRWATATWKERVNQTLAFGISKLQTRPVAWRWHVHKKWVVYDRAAKV